MCALCFLLPHLTCTSLIRCSLFLAFVALCSSSSVPEATGVLRSKAQVADPSFMQVAEQEKPSVPEATGVLRSKAQAAVPSFMQVAEQEKLGCFGICTGTGASATPAARATRRVPLRGTSCSAACSTGPLTKPSPSRIPSLPPTFRSCPHWHLAQRHQCTQGSYRVL